MAGVNIGIRAAICSECGVDLVVHKTGNEPQSDDRVTCPVHGDIGSYHDVSAAAIARFEEKVGKGLKEAFGFKLN